MTKEKIQEIAFQMIGELAKPKNDVLLGLKNFIKTKNQKVFKEILNTAEITLGKVGRLHLDVIKEEASGKNLDFSLILLHAEDQFMTIQLLIEVLKAIYD